MLTLKIQQRDKKESPKDARENGRLPAVFYGRKEESTPIAVETASFEKIFRVAGESTIISLEGVGEPKEALIHDVDVHPVTSKPQHVDFYVIEKGKKLTVNVPIEFSGESPAVDDLGAILVKVIHEVEIEALPKDLPHELIVDISTLKEFNDQITIKDISLPEGVKSLLDEDEVVVMVSEPKEEEEEEATEIDMDSIEVEGASKEEGDGETSSEENKEGE